MVALAKKARTTYPDHDYAADHRLLKARSQLPARRKLRDAAEIRPCGEVACERIREFAWDVGAELREEQPNRWMAPIARNVLGLESANGYEIICGNRLSVSTRTVDAVSLHTGIPPEVFYAE
jgi:hypothetical protein